MPSDRPIAPVSLLIPVQWGEMDAFEHVNNIVYFRYFESARIAYFQKMGIVGDPSRHVGPILASTSCKFIYPLSFPDSIYASARVREVGVDRFTMEYTVYSEGKQRLAAKGEGVIVSYDYREKRKAALPDFWRSAIAALESGEK